MKILARLAALALASAATLLPAAPAVIISPARLDAIRENITARAEPTWTAFAALKAHAESSLTREPHTPANGKWRVPGFYQDEAGHRAAKDGLADDAQAAYACALYYRLGGELAHAERAAALCDAWAQVRSLDPGSDSPLAYSYHFPPLIFAADLLRDSPAWSADHERRFAACMQRIRKEHDRVKYRWNTWTWDTNWGAWGAVLGLSAAAWLDDAEWFATMSDRAKHLVEATIDAKGEFHKEVTRNQGRGTHGVWYSHFTLQPLTISAEIARQRGIDLYGHVSPSGRSLRQAYDTLLPWVADPRSFPYLKSGDLRDLKLVDRYSYFELLQARWPSPATEKLLVAARPMTSPHGLPFTTLTHAGLPAGL